MVVQHIPKFGQVPTWTVNDVMYVYYATGQSIYVRNPGTDRFELYQPNVKSVEDAETFIA